MTETLERPFSTKGLAAFRMAFGALMFVSVCRFAWYGWIDEFFVKPQFFFKYWGFSWVVPFGRTGMHVAFVALGALSVLVAVGAFYRASITLFFLLFTYVQLIDVTNYLNHYYLTSLLALLLCFTPAHARWSVDAWRNPNVQRDTLPAIYTYLLRFQVAAVYFYAGLAKFNTDWLLHGEPMTIWLNARTHLPVLGPLFRLQWMPVFMSWAGFLFDTGIPFLMMATRTRPFAYVAIVIFHVVTHLAFPIGMFPAIMVTSALIFFSPKWPDVFLRRIVRTHPHTDSSSQRGVRVPQWAIALSMVYVSAQVLIPLRHRFYGDNVSWHEQGMRWSWKVMLHEKNGSVHYRVVDASTGRTWHVSPHKYLTERQLRDFSTQPDLVLQLAHHIANSFRARGVDDVHVYVDALVSLNGRPAARLIDPNIDLLTLRDGIRTATWILLSPQSPPPALRPVS